MSALRRMRETDRSIAFKPWIYEIAKNACIDQFRRSKRAEEVSYDADEGLAAADYGRLVTSGPTPDAAVDQKLSLDHLCGAFGGLSETHHEILVMRELEGLSYREIGERLGMSRPSVESTLFRARRRLTEEYSELTSGERCRRIQAIIADAATGSLGARDQKRMARHVSYCQPCRRQARLAGLDSSVLVHTPLRAKIAAFLPLPAFLKRRWGGGGNGDVSGAAANHAPTIAQWSSQVSDPSLAGWVKAAATAATIALAGAGAGAITKGDAASLSSRIGAAHVVGETSRPASAPASNPTWATGATVARKTQRSSAGRSKTTTHVTPLSSGGSGSGSGTGGTTTSVSTPSTPSAPSAPSASAPAPAPSLPGTSGGSTGSRPISGSTTTEVQPLAPVQDTVDNVTTTVSGTVTDTGTQAGDTVDNTVNTVTGALPGG
jgi:RNA polymerase sigma factor (sigma-70 family)